jgi:hypothetical protein
VERRDDALVCIESNGPDISEIDRKTLAAGSETPLRHAEGLGLWLAYWCVIENGGELVFDESCDIDETDTTAGGETGATTRDDDGAATAVSGWNFVVALRLPAPEE